ncbi:RacP protein [Kitasatospora sp. NPDC048194]|uniref:RacP protein n=1 Tax=Kitasatospora sp. NPDC048194 TaxID=3364045 RepID=UPI0037121014
MPRASRRRSPAAERHADTVRKVLFEARPAGLAFDQLTRASSLSASQARAGLACLRDTIAERGWPPLIWTRADGYRFCSDPVELQAYEAAVIRERLTEFRRFITGVVAPHFALQPKGRWVKHLNTQISSVESTLEMIADYSDA